MYNSSSAVPICSSTDSVISAFKLLNALCAGCLQNVCTLRDLLVDLFYSGMRCMDLGKWEQACTIDHTSLLSPGHEPPIVEWEYLPHIGPRPPKGFVGLKNAGATCYMNSVLQQLYMIAPIRNKVLEVTQSADDLIRELQEEEAKEKEVALNKNKEEVSGEDVLSAVMRQ